MSDIPEIGKAYRGRDGLIRWVRSKTVHGRLMLLMLHEESGIWHHGGALSPESWQRAGLSDGGEVPAPQPGETIRRMGTLGRPYAETLP